MAHKCCKGPGLRLRFNGWFCVTCCKCLTSDATLSGPKLVALWNEHVNDDTGRVSEPSKDGKGQVGTPSKRNT